MNLLPLPTWLVTRISPPCSRRILRLTASPRPVPREPFRADEGLEDVVQSSRARCPDHCRHRALAAIRRLSRAWRRQSGRRSSLDGIQGIGHDVQKRPMNSFRDRSEPRASRRQFALRVRRSAPWLAPACSSTTSRTMALKSVDSMSRLALLGIAEHIHDQVVDFALVLFDDSPALLQHRFVFVLQARASGPRCRS